MVVRFYEVNFICSVDIWQLMFPCDLHCDFGCLELLKTKKNLYVTDNVRIFANIIYKPIYLMLLYISRS